jgi:hypothetical protein
VTAYDRDGQPLPVGPIREPVPGAPRQPGELVVVAAAIDRAFHDVSEHIGKTGRVAYLEYGCGCGQRYPDDPMIGVELDDGSAEEFWREELRRWPRRSLGAWRRPPLALMVGVPTHAFDVTLKGRMWTHPVDTFAEATW